MDGLIEQVRATSAAEIVGAVLGLAYLLFAMRRSLWCWLCAFVSSAIYLVLFAKAALYMQSALQVFYIAMAVYGYIDWKRGRTEDAGVIIRRWTIREHAVAVAAVFIATSINGWLLVDTDAAAPYLDSFVTWGSVITTWMVARRVLENWLYWVVVDGLAAYLYFSQGLLVTTVLFLIYLGIVVGGYVIWRREQRLQTATNVRHATT